MTLLDRDGAPSVQGLWDQGLFTDALTSAVHGQHSCGLTSAFTFPSAFPSTSTSTSTITLALTSTSTSAVYAQRSCLNWQAGLDPNLYCMLAGRP